jgi:hypothetical protein
MCGKEKYEVVVQTGKQGGKQVTDKAGYMKDQNRHQLQIREIRGE